MFDQSDAEDLLSLSRGVCLFLEMLPSFLQKVDVVSEASRETCAALSDCLTLLAKQEGVGPVESRFPAVEGALPTGRPVSQCFQNVHRQEPRCQQRTWKLHSSPDLSYFFAFL